MKVSRSTFLISCAWVFFVGGYAAVTLLASRDSTVAAFGYFFACMVPLFANTCLLGTRPLPTAGKMDSGCSWRWAALFGSRESW